MTSRPYLRNGPPISLSCFLSTGGGLPAQLGDGCLRRDELQVGGTRIVSLRRDARQQQRGADQRRRPGSRSDLLMSSSQLVLSLAVEDRIANQATDHRSHQQHDAGASAEVVRADHRVVHAEPDVQRLAADLDRLANPRIVGSGAAADRENDRSYDARERRRASTSTALRRSASGPGPGSPE